MKKIKMSKLDLFVYMVWILFFGGLLASFDYRGANFGVVLTFFIIGLFSLLQCIRPQRNVSIKRNIYIFCLIFYFFAPLQQYLSGTLLWKSNGMAYVYEDIDYFFANVLIFFSITFFELGHYNYTKKYKGRLKNREIEKKPSTLRIPHKSMYMLMMIASGATALIIATDGLVSIASNSAIILQVKHMLLFAPVICMIICMIAIRNGYKNGKKYLFFLSILTFFIFTFYFGTMARFIMLGAFMAITSYLIVDYKNKSIYFSVYILGFFFAFSMMRYTNLSFDILHFVDFRQNDYDAYQIFMLAIHYVKEEGISWGMNLLSALFCLIPRSFANWRLESTGGIVISYVGSWFKNVSCSVQSEMYFAFGTPGVIVLSYLLGRFVAWLDKQYEYGSYFANGIFAILSGLSVYIMRGSLLATYSYTLGILIAYWCIYKVVFLRR